VVRYESILNPQQVQYIFHNTTAVTSHQTHQLQYTNKHLLPSFPYYSSTSAGDIVVGAVVFLYFPGVSPIPTAQQFGMALSRQILLQRTSMHFVANGMIGALPFRHGLTVWIEFQRSCVPMLHVGCVGRVLLIVQASVIAVGDSVSIAVGGFVAVAVFVALVLLVLLLLNNVRGDA
jgi:hypothetical protein